jgi:hypothetical protein
MYYAGWELFAVTHPGFQAKFSVKYIDYQSQKMKSKGIPQADIDKTNKEMLDMLKMAENPLMLFATSLVEILPVGIVITLICAAILRKKEVLPVSAEALSATN